MPDRFISIDQGANDLLACAAFIGERIKSSDGHAEAMNEIVPRYLAQGNVDLSAEMANAVDDPFSRDKLLIRVAEKCAEIDDDEYALQLADAIEDHGLQAQAFERIGLAKAQKGQVEAASETADLMSHPDFVYAGIAVHQATSGNSAGADATLAQIEFPTARVSALHQIATNFIASERIDDAVAPLDEAVKAADEIEHDEERIRATCESGNLFIQAGRNDRAIETFAHARTLTEMLDNQHRDFFLVNCSLGFLQASSTEFAENTLDLITDKTQMASALLGFAREEWKNGEKEAAVDTLDEAYEILRSQRESETRDSRSRNALLTNIATQFAGFGKTDRGIEIAQENHDPNEQVSALSQIAQILTVQNEDAIARDTVNLIHEDADRLFALIGMSDAMLKRGDSEGAMSLLDEAASLTDTVPQHAARSGVLNEIAGRFATQGQPEKARAAALDSLNVISEIRDESSQAAALAGLADVYAEAGLDLGDEEKQRLHTLSSTAEWR